MEFAAVVAIFGRPKQDRGTEITRYGTERECV